MRLDPFPPFNAPVIAWANDMLKRYGEAVRSPRESALRLPNLRFPHLNLACAYAQLGQLEEARKETREVLRINPGFTIERFKRQAVYKDPKDVEHRLDGLRKAGLPETDIHTSSLVKSSSAVKAAHRARCPPPIIMKMPTTAIPPPAQAKLCQSKPQRPTVDRQEIGCVRWGLRGLSSWRW
jgi:hypothetical protein